MLFCFVFSLFVHRIESSDWGIKAPPSLYVLKDHTAYLDCEFSFPEGHSFKRAYWYKDRSLFFCRPQYDCNYGVYDPRVSISEDISTRRNCTLTINNVKISDSGKYYFRFYTSTETRYGLLGTRLHVNARPENLTLSVPTVLEAGNQATITCSVHNVYPSESASMQFESGGIEGTSMQQTQENEDRTCIKTVTFTFIPQHFHNRKNLSCSVAHPNLTHTLQANVTLDIKYDPRNVSVSVSPSGTIKEGDSVVLWCGADSNPGVSRYSWFKQPAESSSWVGVNGLAAAELRIPLASRTDSGRYRCIAENADGDSEASGATSLDIQYPPDVVRVSPCDNHSLCWVCEVEANPLANLTWLEDSAAGRRLMLGGELLHNGTRTSLRIQMTQQKEELICAAVNSHGQKQEVKTINKKGGTALNTIIPAAVGTLAAFITAVALFCFVRRKGRETRQRDSSAEASPEVIYDVVQNLTEDQVPAAKVSDEEEELVYADLDLAPRGKRNWEPVSESELTEYSDLKTVAQLKAGDTAASQE